MALTYTPQVLNGQSCPEFKLPAMDGRTYEKKDFINGNALVIMFICNHCPYVKAIEDRLIELGKDLKALDVNVVAICSNDSESYAEDSFENLRKRYFEKAYTFTYLYDEDQSVAKAFGAVCTPDFFVFDSKQALAYRGRLDDSWKDAEQVTKRELYEAVLAINAGDKAPAQQWSAMGCSIKWK